ncbi:HtaA domain-containing protein [Conexibacter sp. CPCC 206217]|uniref:HtaA domain-containing protein n=1 Tax=Conexibacter sp. CPCC 206217 TaxID=3064574 RepID=UPI00271B596E|nr:HtaA domain-containing protein [Conexibacter sp. CPCC 206217]MDO8212633.1 HtaA domain-containing protein [Conexibacter sp. CPCC 206217]
MTPRSLSRASITRGRGGRRGLRRLLGLAALAVMLLSSAPALAAQIPIARGDGLDWGLKESWRRYIGDGGTTVSDGATRNADGTFHFPVTGGSYEDTTRTTTVQFGGTLVFLGHCEGGGAYERPCALDMTLTDPRVELTEDGGFLYAKMTSKPIEGGEAVDLPDVRLAALDLEDAAPVVAAGVTSWNRLPATVTAAGSQVFTYAIGTVIDPVSFSYEGPGGKPLGEVWSEPNLATYTAAPLAGAAVATRLAPGLSSSETLVRGPASIAIADPATLVPKTPTASIAMGVVRDTIAFDPSTRTIFAAENGNQKQLLVYRWDGTTLSGGVAAGSDNSGLSGDPSTQGAGVWDAANARYLVARQYATRQDLWQIRSVAGVWTASRVATILGPNGQPYAGKISSLAITPAAVPFGGQTIVAAPWSDGPLVALSVGADSASVEPLAQAAGVNANELFRTANGLYAFGNDGIWWLPTRGTGAAAVLEAAQPLIRFPQGAPLWDANRTLNWIAVDPTRDTLYAATNGLRRITRIVAGRQVQSFAVPGIAALQYFDHYLAGTDPDGNLLLASTGSGTVTRLSYASATPSFTTQPQDTDVRLAVTGTTAQATFSVAVTGDPAPTVRWQSRIPGVGRWTDLSDGADVSGATTTTLRARVGAADGGRQYRAIATNADGEVASSRATLDVKTLPVVSVAPESISVVEGEPALFRAMPSANPEAAVLWQRRVAGYWTAVDDDSGDFAVDGGALTVLDPTLEMSGSQFRARLRNEVGTVYTRAVTLTVARRLTGPVSFGGGSVEWGFAERWRCYVVGTIARGGIVTSGGAQQIPGTLANGPMCAGRGGSEAVRFPVRGGSYDPLSGRLTLTLGGSVRFWGHDYHVPGDTRPQLDTTFSNLRLVAEGGTGTLYADTVGATMDNLTPVARTGVALVSVDLGDGSPVPTGDGLAWSALPTALTADGSAVFGSYAVGEPFDALSLAPAFGEPRVDPGPEPQPQPDPQPQPQPGADPLPLPQPPAPKPAPKPAPAPAAKFTVARAARALDRNRRVALATIACPKAARGGCRVATAKRVGVVVGGRRFSAAVVTPRTVAAGRSATLRVQLTKAAARRLAGRSARVRVKVTTTVAGKRTARTIAVTVKGARTARARG